MPPDPLNKILILLFVLCAPLTAAKKTEKGICFFILEQLKESHSDVPPSLKPLKIDYEALSKHLEEVYLSVAGLGKLTPLELKRFCNRLPTDKELLNLEFFAWQTLNYLQTHSPYHGIKKRDQHEELGMAEDLVVAIHLPPELQARLEKEMKRLLTNLRFGKDPKFLFLIDPESKEHLSESLSKEATGIEYSKGGEFPYRNDAYVITIQPKRVHVMGGYYDQCLPKTIYDAIKSALENGGGNSELTVIIHAPWTYTHEHISLVELKKKNKKNYYEEIGELAERLKEEDQTHFLISYQEGKKGRGVDYELEIMTSNGKMIRIQVVSR